jgi:ABC-type transporter Mla MlaB component
MFRVTVKAEDSVETWELEGKLSGEWVKELERCWRERSRQSGNAIRIQLKAVSYIDAAGKQLLTEMHERGVQIEGCGCMTRAVVKEIVGETGER